MEGAGEVRGGWECKIWRCSRPSLALFVDVLNTGWRPEPAISACLNSPGILSLVQIYRFKLADSGYYIGTGLVSVLGTSFTFVPIARTSIGFMMQEDSGNKCVADVDCKLAWANIPGVAIPGETNKG